MSESLLGQLEDEEARQAVLDATFAMFRRWHLHDINQAQLLGLANLKSLKQHMAGDVAAAILTRMGNLLAIERALNKYFRYEPQKRDRWIFQPQQTLNGETPLAFMLGQGDNGIREVKQLAESLSEV